uniref:Uncharacterized protein n=1 Tax=Panagrolaimus sp. ES5 TaxID=591445 RepID=A0AC34FID3_9BILA
MLPPTIINHKESDVEDLGIVVVGDTVEVFIKVAVVTDVICVDMVVSAVGFADASGIVGRVGRVIKGGTEMVAVVTGGVICVDMVVSAVGFADVSGTLGRVVGRVINGGIEMVKSTLKTNSPGTPIFE